MVVSYAALFYSLYMNHWQPGFWIQAHKKIGWPPQWKTSQFYFLCYHAPSEQRELLFAAGAGAAFVGGRAKNL